MRNHQESNSDAQGELVPGIPIRGVTSWNLLQNRLALSGLVLILILILIPPWEATAPNGMTGSVGHYFIFSSMPAQEWKYPRVDYSRLFLEITGILLLAAIAVFVTRNNRE